MTRRPGEIPWWRRGWIVAAAVAAAGAVIGVVAPPTFRTGPKGTPTIVRTTVATGQLVGAPQIAFTGLAWLDFHGVFLPYSSEDGPRRTDGELAMGFARTPRGALLAAVHITVRANVQWGSKVFEPTIRQQVIGPDAATLLASIRAAYEHRKGGRPEGAALGRGYVVLEGFRWQGYSPETASVDLVSAGPGDSDITVRAVTRIQLQWQDGDWRVLAPPAGAWGASATSIDSPDGYVRFPDGASR
jgi:hypothetical protein